MTNGVRQLWSERTRRERMTIGIGSAVLVLSAAYAYAWLPIAQQRERLEAELPRLRVEAQQMRAAAKEIERARAAAKPVPDDLSAILTRSTADPRFAGMNLQLSEAANGRVRASFASVSSERWFAWIAALQIDHGVRVESSHLEVLGQTDVLKAAATLAAGRP